MLTYEPPVAKQMFLLFDVLRAEDAWRDIPAFSEMDRDLVGMVLEGAGKFAAKTLLPLNPVGDREGCSFNRATGEVGTPSGFKEAYASYVEGGWPSLACQPEHEGQGLPGSVNACVFEMLNAANQAWTMYPGLSFGAYACLAKNGSEDLKAKYLPGLVSGAITGTMCLTEAQCGTDLGLVRTKAVPEAGAWRISGEKIFISAGEHDLAGNIVHLVLARVEGSPAGVGGLSLFLVPRRIDGIRNGVACVGLEHKMGIHGNATCRLVFEEATGWLVGEKDRGLAAMFVMMNAARLGVGNQSLGLLEIAAQNATVYAEERLQSRALSGPKRPDLPADPISSHPDVRRMVMTARTLADGCRALLLLAALLNDVAQAHPELETRKRAEAAVSLVTPVAKAFVTESAWRGISEALQVFGGHGYIVDFGMEQLLRDARINMIYEGTNGVQALDFLGRKVLKDGGQALGSLAEEISGFLEEAAADEEVGPVCRALQAQLERTAGVVMTLGQGAAAKPEAVGRAAVPLLRVVGLILTGWLLVRTWHVAKSRNSSFTEELAAEAKFHAGWLLPEATGLLDTVEFGPAL